MENNNAFYTPEMLPQIYELMSKGASPVQVAAALHISKQDLESWVMNPDSKYDELRDTLRKGLTAAEAYWETQGQKGITGNLKYFRDTSWKFYMQNKFKWIEKTEIQEIKPQLQVISDEILTEQIKILLDDRSKQKSTDSTPSGTGPKD